MKRHWREWRPSCMIREDHASAAQPHDETGNPTASYWLAWPPFIEAGLEKVVMRKRFRSAKAAMDYVDETWPLLDDAIDGPSEP